MQVQVAGARGQEELKEKQHKSPFFRYRSLILTAALLLPITAAMIAYPINLGEAAERIALLSAMVNMPEGSLTLLEEHFAGDIDNSYYTGDPDQVAQYVKPWQEEGDHPQGDAQYPSNSASDTPKVSSDAPKPTQKPDVPMEHRGTILQENMAKSGSGLIEYGAGLLRNYTELGEAEISEVMNQGMSITLEDTDAPQVLIFHTHATEAYEPYDSTYYDMRNTWRSTDNDKNMVVVGEAIAQELREAGITVIHDTTQHDYPSYNGSYERSAKTIQDYLDEYPTIQIALDIHRDAIQREEDLIVKPVIEIDGKKAAQVMIITGTEDGTMNVPNWRSNLRFAASLQDQIEQDFPQLTRPIFFCYRKYNMDKTPGSLLLEVGGHANTLEESEYTGEMVGKSLAKLLVSTMNRSDETSGEITAPEDGDPLQETGGDAEPEPEFE